VRIRAGGDQRWSSLPRPSTITGSGRDIVNFRGRGFAITSETLETLRKNCPPIVLVFLPISRACLGRAAFLPNKSA